MNAGSARRQRGSFSVTPRVRLYLARGVTDAAASDPADAKASVLVRDIPRGWRSICRTRVDRARASEVGRRPASGRCSNPIPGRSEWFREVIVCDYRTIEAAARSPNGLIRPRIPFRIRTSIPSGIRTGIRARIRPIDVYSCHISRPAVVNTWPSRSASISASRSATSRRRMSCSSATWSITASASAPNDPSSDSSSFV